MGGGGDKSVSGLGTIMFYCTNDIFFKNASIFNCFENEELAKKNYLNLQIFNKTVSMQFTNY